MIKGTTVTLGNAVVANMYVFARSVVVVSGKTIHSGGGCTAAVLPMHACMHYACMHALFFKGSMQICMHRACMHALFLTGSNFD